MDDFKPGDVIKGKYEVTQVLGQGGMGVVLAALHRELGEPVAIKFPRAGLRDQPDAVARFKQEARAGMRIKNRHVAQVYDVDTVDGSPFIVMEYLTGQDLSAILRERGPLPVGETADLLVQACEALHEAHALGIVHRDLKPSNLFVTKELDGTPFVKVLDFGISKWTGGADPSATASSATMGTPSYMSPEQLMSTKSVDARSDVWALGVILYEMLTDAPPFHGDTSAALQLAILQGTFPKPTEVQPDIPPPVEELLLQALVKDPGSRLSSVVDFAARLAPFGSDVARLSNDRVQRLASRPPASAGAPDANVSPGSEEPRVRPSPSEIPATDGSMVGTPAPAPRAVDGSGKASPRSLPWKPMAALGVAAAAAIAIAAPRLRQAPAGSSVDTPPAASVASTSTEAPGTSAAPVQAPGEGTPAESTTAVASATASAPPGDTRPSSPVDTTSTTGAVTASTKPTAADVAACAAGATAECEAACTANRPGSCLKLAEALQKGVGAPKDLGRAMSLFNQGCNQGSAASCTDVGMVQVSGEGLVSKDPELGVKFLSRGCNGGDARGCLGVSTAYRDGVGIGQNPDQAFSYADRACTRGSREGCVRVALAKITGAGVTKDVKGGLAQLDALCTKREVLACESLQRLYAAGTDVQADPLLRQEYAKKACDLGSKTNCSVGRLMTGVDSAKSTMSQGTALMQSQCDAGKEFSCKLLGEILLKGSGAGDREKGLALLKKACDSGVDPAACKELAEASH